MQKDELDLGPGELDTDHIPVRRLGPDDLEAVVRIDTAGTGHTRTELYRTKLARALEDSGIQLSLSFLAHSGFRPAPRFCLEKRLS